MPELYSTELLGRAAVTEYDERGTVTGPALDPARCRFQPETPGTEYFTPRMATLTFDELEDTSEDPCTDHGFDVCPDCGNGGVKIDSTGYVDCTRFLTCWADPDETEGN